MSELSRKRWKLQNIVCVQFSARTWQFRRIPSIISRRIYIQRLRDSIALIAGFATMSLCSLQPSDNPKACKTIGNAQRLQSLCHSFRSNYQKLGAFARHERRKWRRAPSKACALFVISGSDVHRDVQRGDIWIVGEEGGDRRGGGVYIKRVLCKFFDPLNVPPSSSLHRQPPFRISPLVTEPSNGVKRAPIT